MVEWHTHQYCSHTAAPCILLHTRSGTHSPSFGRWRRFYRGTRHIRQCPHSYRKSLYKGKDIHLDTMRAKTLCIIIFSNETFYIFKIVVFFICPAYNPWSFGKIKIYINLYTTILHLPLCRIKGSASSYLSTRLYMHKCRSLGHPCRPCGPQR